MNAQSRSSASTLRRRGAPRATAAAASGRSDSGPRLFDPPPRPLRYQFVDCRWELGNAGRGRELYLDGHVPGASFLDVERDLSAPAGPAGRHPLPGADDFAGAVSRAGIGPSVFAVAYGSMGGAERLWWLLRHFGHDDCATHLS